MGQTIITKNLLTEKVQVSVTKPKLETPSSLSIPKPVSVESQGLKPVSIFKLNNVEKLSYYLKHVEVTYT